MILSIFFIVLLLSFLVVIHELGHFIAAVLVKVKVEEFGIGYPPLVRKLFTWKNTHFTLNAVPFGGFVRLEGEDLIGEELEPVTHSATAFSRQSASKKLFIIVAGAAVNFIFGVLVFAGIFAAIGIPTAISSPRIGALVQGSPAQKANLPLDVEIIAVSSGSTKIATKTRDEVITTIKQFPGQTVQLTTTGVCVGMTCQESAQEFSVYVRTPEELQPGEGAVGIVFAEQVFQKFSWYEMPIRALFAGGEYALLLVQLTFSELGASVMGMFKGTVPTALSGPVGIVYQAHTQQILSQGWVAIVHFIGGLSVGLAVMNLLPVPALDGGRAVFVLLEMVGGKNIAQKWEAKAHQVGFIALLALIVLITIKDVFGIIR